jgi:hypothetical protein
VRLVGIRRRLAGPWVRCSLVLALLVGILAQSGLALGQIGQGATLTVIRGAVSVVRTDGTSVSPAATGLLLGVGDKVATVGRSAALVTFFDGSEVELGADTAIAIHEIQANSAGQITIFIENLLGSTVHHIVTFIAAGSTYRILAGGTVTEVHGTTLGHRIDEHGNVTVYLIDSSGTVTFPNDQTELHNGEACTMSSSGDLVCQSAHGKDVWTMLADGVYGNQTQGTGNPGMATGSTGSKPGDRKDDAEKKVTPATPTPTGTQAADTSRTPTPATTATVTPTVTVTVSPTATSTPTLGPEEAPLPR